MLLFLIRSSSQDPIISTAGETLERQEGHHQHDDGPRSLEGKIFFSETEKHVHKPVGAGCQHGEKEGDLGYDNPCIY